MSALEGASKYLNNLLLARGLLPNGKPVDFAHPARDGESTDATMSKIINLIHELVLRRDRESEQHESMAASIRSLRVSESQQQLEFKQMQDKNHSLQSDALTAQSQERAARTSLKKLEQQVKELKEQNLKMKSVLDQVRAKCTSDVRKRDTEIDKLKAHVLSLQRGKRDHGSMRINTLTPWIRENGTENRDKRQNVNSADWCLQQETNEFLTAIVNETSAENVSLRKIVDDTLETLRDMTGYEDDRSEPEKDGIGIPGQYRKSRTASEALIPTDELSEQMDTILQHCRTILKDPSFVPIEEVQVRDEEIVKLRAGWEKMADRWKEAISMMGQWKQRMMVEGKSADIGELSDLSFGRSMAIMPNGQPVLGHDVEFSIFEESRLEEGTVCLTAEENSEEAESDLELEPVPETEGQPALKRLAASPARRGVRLPRPVNALSETNGNAKLAMVLTKQSSCDSTSEISSDIGLENQRQRSQSKLDKLTISEKLAAIEAEANAVKQTEHNRKRKIPIKGSQRKTRRRSTLSPEELASIMNAG